MLPDLDREQAGGVSNGSGSSLAGAHVGDHPAFTASFGVTDSTCGDRLDQLLQLADAALYAAKESGRDRIVINDARADEPTTAAAPETSNRTAPRAHGRGSFAPLHPGIDEEDPHPSGLEIR